MRVFSRKWLAFTEYTYEQLTNPATFQLRELGEQEIRGMEQKVHLFEVQGAT